MAGAREKVRGENSAADHRPVISDRWAAAATRVRLRRQVAAPAESALRSQHGPRPCALLERVISVPVDEFAALPRQLRRQSDGREPRLGLRGRVEGVDVNEYVRRIAGIDPAGVANCCEPILVVAASAVADPESVRSALKADSARGIEIAENVLGVAE